MLKVKSPMATSLLRVGRTAGLSLVDEHLAAANVPLTSPLTRRETHTPGRLSRVADLVKRLVRACLDIQRYIYSDSFGGTR
jgi:hypothetical protein